MATASIPAALASCAFAIVAGSAIAPTFTTLNGLLDRIALPGTLLGAVIVVACRGILARPAAAVA